MGGWWRWVLGLGLTICLLLALVAGLLTVLTRLLAASMVTTEAIPQPLTSSPAAAERLERKLEEFTTALEQGGDEPVIMIVSEEELTAKIAQALAESPDVPPLSNLQIRLKPDRVLLSARVAPWGQPLDLKATFRLRVVEGEADFGVAQANLGGLPLPAAGLQQLLGGLHQGWGAFAQDQGPPPRETPGIPPGLKTLRIEEKQVLVEVIPSQLREALGLRLGPKAKESADP